MSELKARGVDDVYIEYYNTGKHELAQVYLKSEADKVIAELEEKLKAQTSIAEERWKEVGKYHTSYAEAVKELYDKNKDIARLQKELEHSNVELESYFIFENEIKAELRAARRSLWMHRAITAKLNKEGCKVMREYNPFIGIEEFKWQEVERKCRAKAEQYK